MRTIGISTGQTEQFSAIDFIEWNLIRESTIFLACRFCGERIYLREIKAECKSVFRMSIILFLRHGICHQSFRILKNSLITCRKIKRKHLLWSQKLHVKAREYSWQEILRTWINMITSWCNDTCINHFWLMSSSLIYAYMSLSVELILWEFTCTMKDFVGFRQ